MSNSLKGKVAIVWGGTGNVGSVICHMLADLGAMVVVHYHSNTEKASKIIAQIRKRRENDFNAIAISADANKEEDILQLLKEANEQFGSVDIVVNCIHGDFNPIFIADMEWDDWEVHLAALKTHFNICKSILPYMRRQRYGRVVFISGGLSYRLMKGCSAYSTVKAGLNAFCRTLALEEGVNNITVNIVAPGRIVEEGCSSSMNAPEAWEEIESNQLSKTPLGRSANAVDIANAVLYFVSPGAENITGQTIFVTGGEVMPVS